MKKTAKKVLSLLLCAILCISILPAAAFAENDEGKEQNIAAAEAPDDSDTPPAAEEEPSPAEDTAEVSAAPEQETPVEALTAEEGTEEDTPSIVASGSCGENVTWELYDSGTLVISGTGAMEDYCDYSSDPPIWTDAPWKEHRAEIKDVVIEDGIVNIGVEAFRECRNLTNISIPDSVTSIGDAAFFVCESLTGIIIPASVTSIGVRAFDECSSLESITIPNSVISLDAGAFTYCPKLAEILVEEGNTAYSSLDGVLFNFDRTELICYPAGKSTREYIIPDGVVSIAEAAFNSCALERIIIPDTVTAIVSGAFSDCGKLTEITFKGDAPSIGDSCFTGVTATAYYPAGNGTWTETVMQDYGGSITWTAKVMNGTLTGTAVSWDGNGNEVICLYSGLSEEEIQADITAGAAGASYIAQCGAPGQNADGERYNVDFCFEKADVGEYTLAVYKPGGYVLKTLSVTVNGDAELGEIALQLRGDISGDGSVNTMDLIRLMKYINGEPVDIAPGSGDVNGDGRENIMDLIRLMKYINGENG